MEFLDWYVYVVVFATGLICGVINTLAGGGSLITLPLLMMLMPDKDANVTNRLGFLLQSIVASWQFKKKKIFEWSWGMRPVAPLVIGTIVGALIAVNVNIGIIKQATGILLVLMLPVIFLQPEKWLKNKITSMPQMKWWLYPAYFVLGIYAGFLQAGIGYFLLAFLVIGTGYDMLTANAIKVFVVLFTTIAALVVFFIYAEKITIHYDVGMIQAAGQAMGAYLGVKLAFVWKPQIIRWLLIALIVAFALRLLIW